MLAARHTRLICAAETLARTTFTDILAAGDDWIGEAVNLRKEFGALIRLEKCRYESLRADLNNWRVQVTCGEIDLDPAREDEFKSALRALIALEDLLIEKFDIYSGKGFLLEKSLLIGVVQAHRRCVQASLDTWKSPEWETTGMPIAEWNEEQSRHLLNRIGCSQ